MSVIIVLIIISLIVAVFFLLVFVWAVRTGQFDDTVSPSIRILFEDKKATKSNKTKPDQTTDDETER